MSHCNFSPYFGPVPLGIVEFGGIRQAWFLIRCDNSDCDNRWLVSARPEEILPKNCPSCAKKAGGIMDSRREGK